MPSVAGARGLGAVLQDVNLRAVRVDHEDSSHVGLLVRRYEQEQSLLVRGVTTRFDQAMDRSCNYASSTSTSYGSRTACQHRGNGRHRSVRDRDDLIAWTDFERLQRQD